MLFQLFILRIDYLHGVVDGVLSVVLVVFVLVEDTGGAVELELDLGSQSALEVDDPQGLVLTNEDALDLPFFIFLIISFYFYFIKAVRALNYLAEGELDLVGLLEVLLVNNSDFLSRISLPEVGVNLFVELLSLSANQLCYKQN